MQVNSRQMEFDLPFSYVSPTLLTAAEAYLYLGWSVIPLLGDRDPARPKVPAIPWAGFQQNPAQLHELQQWFKEDSYVGMGIVTGRVSKLVVLDFDSESVFNAFRLQYPDLTETRTVRSAGRGLPHLYFHLPSHLNITSQKGQGVDLLSDGHYVVAPPTTIAGQTYTLVRGGMPKVLTERDARRITAFLRSNQPKSTSQNTEKRESVSITGEKVLPKDLHALYRSLTQKGGRNEALFRTTLYARDSGWTPQQTKNCLVMLHVKQSSSESNSRETPAQREREALRTIASAYSRPARPKKPIKHRNTNQLSNSVREALMQHKLTYVIRTYEGLLLAGIQPGQVIASQDAVERLKGQVGRDSVLNALKAKHNNQTLFTPSAPHYAVATVKNLKKSKKCYLTETGFQEKVKMGRPQHLYKMPSNLELCQLFGVSVSASDPLEPADLASAHQTRMALHRELIKRRPGQYTRRWLAHRLGVNKCTIDVYNRLIPIHSRNMFIETAIRWHNIERLPLDESMQGAFLVTLKGKKYPALRSIASFLLARGEGICLNEQTANFYWYGDEEPVLAQMQVKQTIEVRQQKIENFMTQHPIKVAIPTLQDNITSLDAAVQLKQGRGIKQSVAKHDYRKPLKDEAQERLAKQLYDTLNATSIKQISLSNTRRMAATYGNYRIYQALNRLKGIQAQQIVTNPIGLMVTLVRSTSKV